MAYDGGTDLKQDKVGHQIELNEEYCKNDTQLQEKFTPIKCFV